MMKKIVIAALLSTIISAPAIAAPTRASAAAPAATKTGSIGINYGLNYSGVLGIQGEYNLASVVANLPISIQGFYKKGSETFYGVKADIKSMGVAGIYDFSSTFKMPKNLHPYAGAGLARETASVVIPGFAGFGGGFGAYPATTVSTTSTKLYYTGGARYSFTPQLDADANYNQFGGVTVGINFNF